MKQAEQVNTFSPAVSAERDDYSVYRQAGGTLSLPDYKLAGRYLSGEDLKVEIKRRTLECCLCQVRSYARFAGVDLSSQEERLYVILRSKPAVPRSDGSGDFTDQPLLAEIFRLSNPAKYQVFVSQYPPHTFQVST